MNKEYFYPYSRDDFFTEIPMLDQVINKNVNNTLKNIILKDFEEFRDFCMSELNEGALNDFSNDDLIQLDGSLKVLFLHGKFINDGEDLYYTGTDLLTLMTQTDTKNINPKRILRRFKDVIYIAFPKDKIFMSGASNTGYIKGCYLTMLHGANDNSDSRMVVSINFGNPDGLFTIDYSFNKELEDGYDCELVYMNKKDECESSSTAFGMNTSEIFKIIVNILLYIESDGASISELYTGDLLEKIEKANMKKKNNLRKKFKNEVKYRHLGRDIIITDSDRKMFSIKMRGAIDHEFIVRGHYRNQYYPSEDANHLILIKPYIKGEGKGGKNE